MQTYFKNQKMLIGVIGLAILGTANVQAASSFDSQAKIQLSIGNILAGLDVSASFAKAGDADHISSDGISPSVMPMSSSSRHTVANVLAGWFAGNPSIDKPLSTAETYLYSDALNMAVADAAVTAGKDGLARLVPSHSDARFSNIFSTQAADTNPKVSPVPLPAAVWSFLLGLLGILGLKKRKQLPAETI